MANEEDTRSTEQYSTTEHPWRDKEILQSLYCEEELSLREVGDRLNCNRETVRNWLDRYDIDTRPANDQKIGMCYHTNDEGYSYFREHYEGESYSFGEHELAAIQGGADLKEVFSDETHCHHLIRVPTPLNPLRHIEIPDNVEVLKESEHNRKHANDEFDTPDIEEVLCQEDNT